MNTFNKKSLFVALAGVGALGVTGAADAVYVNPDGTGQVLLYPYYTVRNVIAAGAPYQSLLSVVNSTASAKIVKVRFIEGKNSREVLDFNLFLSAHDVWTTAVVPVGAGAGIITTDNSCTLPANIGRTLATATPFVNYAYVGNNADPAGGSLDRTTEGYVEIIEMGAVGGSSCTEQFITHSGGVPANCAALSRAPLNTDIRPPQGGLFGGMSLVNVLAGNDITTDATALEAFRSSGTYDLPGDIKPDLRDADPQWTVFRGNTAYSGTTTNGIDAVSAVLMHRDVLNEFVLDTATLSFTNWVVTYPTKRYYYDPVMSLCGSSQVDCNPVLALDVDPTLKLFQRNFTASGACDDVGITQYNREEGTPRTPGTFSPPPPTGSTPALCWEGNVVTFNGNGVFGSANTANINTTYENGWVDLNLVGPAAIAKAAHVLPTNGGTFTGLPVIGFAAQTFINGTLTDPTGKLIQSAYGGNFAHKYTPGLTTVP